MFLHRLLCIHDLILMSSCFPSNNQKANFRCFSKVFVDPSKIETTFENMKTMVLSLGQLLLRDRITEQNS